MPDPLSVAASIAGLLAITGKVIGVLSAFLSTVSDAPESARRALTSVEHMRLALTSVKVVMDRPQGIDRARKEMIHCTSIAIVFREAVLAFSEFEAKVGTGASDGWRSSAWTRALWISNEDGIQRYLAHTESVISTLGIMLNILQWYEQAMVSFLQNNTGR
jgi:cell division control protein 24